MFETRLLFIANDNHIKLTYTDVEFATIQHPKVFIHIIEFLEFCTVDLPHSPPLPVPGT